MGAVQMSVGSTCAELHYCFAEINISSSFLNS